jgi:hypothetical protein
MNRSQNQDRNRQGSQRVGRNQDNRNQQQPNERQWDGHERRTGAERRNIDTGMETNEGSSR